MRALRYPRWEDYDYERHNATHNRLFWLGKGITLNEETNSGDRKWRALLATSAKDISRRLVSQRRLCRRSAAGFARQRGLISHVL